MQWYEVLVLILGIIGSVFGIFGISAYIGERAKHKAQKVNKKEDEEEAKKMEEQKKLEEMRHEEYKAELKLIINNATAPIIKDLESIKDDIILLKTGVQGNCRSDLEDLADKADKQGYMSAYDKQRFESTYKSYHALGENGVMDAKRERILAMPEHKATAKRRTSKKQVLLENK